MLYFKFPFNDKIYTLTDTEPLHSVEFYTFNGILSQIFKGKLTETENIEPYSTDELNSVFMEFQIENEEDYINKINSVIDFIKENELKKLVISRQKFYIYPNGAQVNLTNTFRNLCISYPNAFAYIFSNGDVCWMGAFSELLGCFNKKTGTFETMSLAGTLPVEEAWTEKEIEEQQPVTGYIEKILKKYSDEISVSKTRDHISGNIKHLRTDFKGKILKSDLENLISELHPTPAVCGIPKEFCKNAIQKFEMHPRDLYSGYIRIENDEFIRYFVNLRCAEFSNNAARIFVGGGITAKSDAAKEWRETELKSQAILKNIVT